MREGLTTVHVRVTDAATRRATPVRLRLTGPTGETFPPLGRLTEFTTGRGREVGGNLRLGARSYALINGACEVNLPAGLIHVEIEKGPEYRSQRLEVPLSAGKLALRFAVERWINLRDQGWYSGDGRCHFLSPHAALLEAAAEDLAVVNLLVEETQVRDQFGKKVPAIPNLLAFSGQEPALARPGHLVAVNTHNIHPILGSLGLLNCHRVVYPLTFGGPDGREDWTLLDWCQQCHRKGGLVVWTRTWQEGPGCRFAEPLADLILGAVDAFEIDFFEDSPFDVLPDWYDLLNCGLRVPLMGASGKDSNVLPLGTLRTYARLQPGENLTYRSWIEAVRAGRTCATNGPLLSFTVNGQDPGAVVEVASPGETVQVRAEGKSAVPFDQLELIADGEVIASASASGDPCGAVLEMDLPVTASGWLALRCRGQQLRPGRPALNRTFAHTSPVYVRVAGQPGMAKTRSVRRLVQDLDHMLDWVMHQARCDTESQRERLAHVFRQAREQMERRGG